MGCKIEVQSDDTVSRKFTTEELREHKGQRGKPIVVNRV